jgi:putative iron-dependent peroxidase
VPQPVIQVLTSAAIFLVVTVKPDADSRAAVRAFGGDDLPALVRSVGFRDLGGQLSCVMGVGSDAWDKIFGGPRPAELHPFREIKAGPRHAPATPGDLMFHIRAKRMDLCFELVTQILNRLGDAIAPLDEVHGFRFFDERDLLGFVDGTENPLDQEALDAVFIGAEDPPFTGGSYVIVQKYLHDMKGWNALPNTIVENGKEMKIVRDNMPFGNASAGEFGTYFIGYCRTPRTTEQMLENMFVGRPPGNYDRILDFSTARTGTLFFVPSATFLENAVDNPAPADTTTPKAPVAAQSRDGSLGIGSLKGDSSHE